MRRSVFSAMQRDDRAQRHDCAAGEDVALDEVHVSDGRTCQS